MSLIPEEEIWAEYWRSYNQRPEGWRLYSGISVRGCPELLIAGEKESWLVRRESLYSGKLGVGGKIPRGISRDSASGSIMGSYGFREVPGDYAERLARGESVDPAEKMRIIADILRHPPTPLDKITSPSLLQGPLTHSIRPLPIISEEQAELDRKLNLELDKWRRRLNYIR